MENRSSQKIVCRKDMQCTCPMCLASFQATWDLRRPLPPNNAFQSITNLDDAFSEDAFRTPTPARFRRGKENDSPKGVGNDEKVCRPVTPYLPLTRSNFSPEITGGFNSPEKKENGRGVKRLARMWVKSSGIVLSLILTAFILPKVMLEVFPPALSRQEVVKIVEGSQVRIRFGDRFDFIQKKLSKSLPGQNVSNCTGSAAIWNLKDAGSLIHSECKMFFSPAESVTVWGFPVTTSGVLGRAMQDRSFTVLSGRVLEWQEGHVEYQIHKEGGSWMHPQWAASAIHLEANTWIVEYKESLFSGLRSPSGILHLLKHQFYKLVSNLKGKFESTTLAYSRLIVRIDTERVPT